MKSRTIKFLIDVVGFNDSDRSMLKAEIEVDVVDYGD
jgi:hypothetical protein